MKIFGYEMGKENPKREYCYLGMYPVLNKHGITDPILMYLKEEHSVLTDAIIIVSSNSLSKHHKNVNIIMAKLIKNGMTKNNIKSKSETGERGVEKTIYMKNEGYEAFVFHFEDDIPSKKTGYTFNLTLKISKNKL